MDDFAHKDVAKTIARFAVGHSVAMIIGTTVKSFAPNTTRIQKVQVYIGAYALAGMVQDQAEDWIDRKIEDWITTYNKVKKLVKNEPPK